MRHPQRLNLSTTRSTPLILPVSIWSIVVVAVSGYLAPIAPTARNGRWGCGVRLSASTEASSSSSSSSSADAMAAEDANKAFLLQCKSLCEARNIPLEKVKNARDLSSVALSPIIPGRFYRMGRVSDATEHDIHVLFQELNITTLVDLRSPTELKDDETLMREAVYGNFTTILWRESGRKKDGRIMELQPGQAPLKKHFWDRLDGKKIEAHDLEDDEDLIVDCEACEEVAEIGTNNKKAAKGRRERHFVSVMNELKYVQGTVSKVRKRDMAKSILKSPGALVSRRVRYSIKKPFLDEINDGGLPMVNDMLLHYGAPGIKYVLDLCADPSRHPIAFYCTAGKDRTGVIAAIILLLCGVPISSIVEDYTLSANVYAEMNDHKAMVGALSQRNLDPKTFLGAPAYVMQDTLEAMEHEFDNVQGYLNWIGFGPEQQEKLKNACLK